MSNSDIAYPIELARELASKYMTDLVNFVERIHVVGSVRREKPQVHDIEVLMIPLATTLKDMFNQPLTDRNRLDENIHWLACKWQAKLLIDGPHKKSLKLVEGPVLEIYVSTLRRWGVEMVIKTGDSDFSHKCVTARRQGGYLPSDCVIKNGWQVYRGEKVIPMAEEWDFLKFLGFPEDLPAEGRCGALKPVLL